MQSLLRDVRVEARLTQAEVASRLGQRQSYVSKYELGEHRLDLPQLDEVCGAIGISLGDFVKLYKTAQAERSDSKA